MASVAELRQILKEDSTGKNLYDHLTETLMKILLDRPTNAFDSFELISAEVKQNPLNPNPVKGRTVPQSADELNKQTKWISKNSSLLKVPEEPPEESGVKYPDLLSEANILEWAGITLGKGDWYRLYLSIKTLAESLSSDVERLRFFGKITTRGLPYYIVEGLSSEDEEDIDEFQQEGRSGVNKYTYWVTQRVDAADGWIKLPNIKSNHIVLARQFKRLLTGDLDASVPSYPPFPGTERYLLRTQIALIVSSTSISPDGFFELDEDNDPPTIKPVEPETLAENFPKAAEDLKDPEAWKHHEIALNPIGRITALPEKLDDNGDVIEPGEEAEVESPLASLLPENWSFRIAPGGAGAAAGSCVLARSLVWPGAVAVSSGNRFVNIYIGTGVPFSATSYTPPLPKDIQSEFIPTEEDTLQLVEQQDIRVDPTPPVPEGEEEQEED